uniref:Uncharacterized protein n=1 Tax=Setaria italica TaxID=4555 RepID=K3Y3T1_SETIT
MNISPYYSHLTLLSFDIFCHLYIFVSRQVYMKT